MPSQTEIRQRITNQIIEALKSGKLPPWRQPWASNSNAGFPTNVASKRRYSGVNPMLLQIAAQKHGFRSKWWGTYKQWESLGKVMHRPAHIEAGSWGTAVIFWKPVEKTEIDPDTGEEETRTFGFLKQYHLFNLDQVEGECLDHLRFTDTVVDNHDFIDFEPAEKAIEATGADLRYGGDRAFYRPPIVGYDGDFIQLPHKDTFSTPKGFYAVALHELMHWSERRIGWQGNYAEGELRAEIGACYSLSELGMPLTGR